MAACRYCGRDISYNATMCPQCGHVVSSSDYDGGSDSHGNHGWGGLAGFLVAALFAVPMISSVLREINSVSSSTPAYAWIGFAMFWLPLAFVCVWVGTKIEERWQLRR